MIDAPIDVPLLPARMLNEFAYCPRLAYLEWVQGEFAHSSDTLEGAWKHRRVDKPGGDLPAPDDGGGRAEAPPPEHSEAREAKSAHDDRSGDGDSPAEADPPGAAPGARIHARSIHLSSEEEGLVAIIDVVEGHAGPAGASPVVTPIDYKRGAVPDIPERAWDADRVQLCAQGLILRARGYSCASGIVYYTASRTRVPVLFDDTLVAHTRQLAAECRTIVESGPMPAPLVDSPKCPRCSLVGICLPDETTLLANAHGEEPAGEPRIRRLIPAADDARPLYVTEPGAYVSKKGERLEVRGKPAARSESRPLLADIRINDLSQVALFGHAQISTEAVRALLDAEIPLAYFTTGGWFHGTTFGLPSKNVELRRRQYANAADGDASLALAKRFAHAKIENQRTILRRNGEPTQIALDAMKDLAAASTSAGSAATLLGIEGNAARHYFAALPTMLRPRCGDTKGDASGFDFAFEKRNRRPPEDPVNSLLSFAYALLARDFTAACWTAGLDPFLGFYHQPRFGRPALALDLMEEFRSVLADSTVITAVNTGVVRASDFVRRGNAVALGGDGRRRFIQAYERRMETEVTHPVFGYQITYRRVLEVQARLLGRVLLGEIDEYPSFLVR